MKAFVSLIKATAIGGCLFLIPAVLILLVLRQAVELARKIATPFAAVLPEGLFGGVAVATVLAVVLLLLVALAAGLTARTSLGRRFSAWVEESVLGAIPQYRMVMSMAEGLAQIETSSSLRPVLVRGDEGWQLAYRIEDLGGGWVTVFLPQAPTPMSGNVLYVTADKIKPLNLSMTDAMRLVKRIGTGSAATLRGVDLGT